MIVDGAPEAMDWSSLANPNAQKQAQWTNLAQISSGPTRGKEYEPYKWEGTPYNPSDIPVVQFKINNMRMFAESAFNTMPADHQNATILNLLIATTMPQLNARSSSLVQWFSALNRLFNHYYPTNQKFDSITRKIKKKLYNELTATLFLELGQYDKNPVLERYFLGVEGGYQLPKGKYGSNIADSYDSAVRFGNLYRVYNQQIFKHLKQEAFASNILPVLVSTKLLVSISKLRVEQNTHHDTLEMLTKMNIVIDETGRSTGTQSFFSRIIQTIVIAAKAFKDGAAFIKPDAQWGPNDVSQVEGTFNEYKYATLWGGQLKQMMTAAPALVSRIAHWEGRGYHFPLNKLSVQIRNQSFDAMICFIVPFNEDKILTTSMMAIGKGGIWSTKESIDPDDFFFCMGIATNPTNIIASVQHSATLMLEGGQQKQIAQYNPAVKIAKPVKETINWSKYLFEVGTLHAQNGIIRINQAKMNIGNMGIEMSGDRINHPSLEGRFTSMVTKINGMGRPDQRFSRVYLTAILFNELITDPDADKGWSDNFVHILNAFWQQVSFKLSIALQQAIFKVYLQGEKKTEQEITVALQDANLLLTQINLLLRRYNSLRTGAEVVLADLERATFSQGLVPVQSFL